MTPAIIFFSTGLAMVAIWIVAKTGHTADLRETAEREFLRGYRQAIVGSEQPNKQTTQEKPQ